MNLRPPKTKELLNYHCVTIAAEYVAEAYYPKVSLCQILTRYCLRQRSY